MRPPKPTFCHAVLFILYVVNVPNLSTHPSDREDVMQSVSVVNELQCQRLCWYRQLCSSYSYHSPFTPVQHNCYLHTDSVLTSSALPTITPDPGWIETGASDSNINSGCRARLCTSTQICVRQDESHTCLPMPSDCGQPAAVSNAVVIVSGMSQGDVAGVECDDGFVTSPKGVSADMVCLVTSAWTPFAGTCHQYEFGPIVQNNLDIDLPLTMSDSTLCVKGVFNTDLAINLIYSKSPRYFFHFKFGHLTNRIIWDLQNGYWNGARDVDSSPLTLRDHFNITLGIVGDALQMTLNGAQNVSIPLADVSDNSGVLVDLLTTVAVYVSGFSAVTYLNLIEGC